MGFSQLFPVFARAIFQIFPLKKVLTSTMLFAIIISVKGEGRKKKNLKNKNFLLTNYIINVIINYKIKQRRGHPS